MADLTKCPACSTAISKSAAACPRCGHPMKGAPKRRGLISRVARMGCLGIVALFVLMVVVALMAPRRERAAQEAGSAAPPTSAPAASRFTSGDLVTLYREGGAGNVLLTTDEEAYDYLQQGIAAKKVGNLTQLREANKAFAATNGTKAVVVRAQSDRALVKLEDGPLAGSELWVDQRHIQKRSE
jgi:predicted nucleic acid-binding Zn ribbon protein